MDYADILVDATPHPSARQTLEAAADFVEAYGGRLSVAAFAWPRTTMLAEALLGSAGETALQARTFAEALETTRAIHGEVAAQRQLATEWCSGISDPNLILADHLLAADLVILGGGEGGQFSTVDPTALSARSGAPVLRIGSHRAPMPFQHVMVAWKDSREARRAVHEALPILRRATRVLILGVGDEVSSDRLVQVADHLVRHKVAAMPLHLSKNAAGVCDQILRHAETEGYDLLASGAYSRSRYSERIMGGVTKALLDDAQMSWLLAH
jgi:nucleotide-binding universal stress UspA family protein